MMRFPYTPVVGQGLGVSYSSLTQLGPIVPSQQPGQANVKVFINIANGNLTVFDHTASVIEQNGQLDFRYVYNSQANPGQAWRLGVARRFKQLPSPTRPFGPTAVLQETDGHETTYTIGFNNWYFAPAHGEGTPYFRYHESTGQWILFEPHSQITEYYDAQGILRKREDAAGRTTTFEYDANQQLTAVVAPNNNRYEIRRAGGDVGIYLREGDRTTLLQVHHFNSAGLLEFTELPNQYRITYQYKLNSSQLDSIEQTDGSVYTFDYENKSQQAKVEWCGVGDSGNRTQIRYDNDKVTLRAGDIISTYITLDAQSRITNLTREREYLGEPGGQDDTQYSYTSKGQLKSIIHPNQGIEEFEYNHVFDLLTQHTQPDGQVLAYQYGLTPDQAKVICRSVYSAAAPDNKQITRYVYDTNYDGQRHSVLRFEISALGCVKEYLEHQEGNPTKVRTFLNATFDVHDMAPDISPCLSEMKEWVAAQNKQQISLDELIYDRRGQVLQTVQYTDIDNSGAGFANDAASCERTSRDEFGLLRMRKVKLSAEQSATTIYDHDELLRPTLIIDALEQRTEMTYLDSQMQVKTQRPNGRVELQQRDKQGLTDLQLEIVGSKREQQRQVSYKRDTSGRAVVTYHPDNRETFSFYDCQDRLGFTVSATGIVVEYQYDLANRCNTTIQYANAVDVTKLRYAPDFLPTVGRLIDLLAKSKAPGKDRYSYQSMDKTGRLRYQVDAERYVSEFRYNALGKVSDELHYAASLSDAQLQQLKQGQTLVMPFDPQHDRCQRSFYNLDGWLIAEQDGAGYVTEYRRDKAGRLQETIRYATPIKPELAQTNYEAIKPAVTVKDAHRYYFRDARGQCSLEVDAEGYVTSHVYRASGLKSHSVRFANKVDPNWYQDTRKLPPFPSASDKDQTTVYHYDLLGRETEAQLPEANLITTAYDEMGHSIYRHVKDNFLPQSTDPSLQRSEQARFDGWEQKITETNPFVAQRLFEIDSDSTLSTEEKNQQKAEVWQNHSIRHVYEGTGLKLKTLDPLGHTTLYYYDTERRPVLTINPRGVVTETSYNNFHEPTVIRQYKKALRADTLTALTGGFMNDLVRQLLVNLRDKVNDSVTQFEHDKRGHAIQTTGPEGHVSTQTFNAFGQCAEEKLPVEGTTPSLTITHRYEGRGLEIETIKQTGAEQIAVKQAYEDVHDKQTVIENEMGQRTKTLRNKLGQPERIINALGHTVQTLTHDSFGRVIKETDALGQDTLHDYSNFDRSHTVSNPETGAKQITQTNVFGKPLVIMDGVGHKTCFAYAPDGHETRHTDALQQTTETQYDWLGQKTNVTFPNKREDTFTYDSVGNLTEAVQDAAGLVLRTQHEYNSFNQQTATVDAKRVRSEFTLDQRGLVKQTLLDPSRDDYQGLDLLTVQSFNGQGQALSTLQGMLTEPNQHYVLHQHDGFNREIGENIDPVTQVHPEGLMIISGKQLNKQGKPIKLVDPNGNVTRLFYDELGQKRFKVDAEGGVMEWRYDANGKLSSEWVYTTKIDVNLLSDSSEPANVQALLKPDADDTCLYHFYDASQRECYTVNSRGTVTEKRYDGASRHVQTTVYKNPVDPKQLQDITTHDLAQRIQPDAAQDRTTYHILDAINQERYIITPDGGITEQIFNKQGHIVAEIQYVNKVADPASLAKLPLADIGAKLVKDPTQDRVTYHLFDNLENPLYLIKPEGAVIGYRYDAQNQLIQECKFAKRITMPADYSAVEAEVKTWQPNRTTDRIIEHERDNAGRIVKTTDALGYSDSFELDAFGQTMTHTDRRGYLWRYQYDRAKRLTKEIKPEAQITFAEHQDLAKRQLVGNSWYTDGDISALVKLSLKQQSQGYAQDCHFLLDGLYTDEGIAYQVVVTPAIDTQGLSTPLDFYLDKARQPAPVVAAVDDRRDVFDEIALSLLTQQNANVKILFPYNQSQQHWLTGEIRLHKQGHVYEIECYAHDPYGQGRMPVENARQLRETLKKRLLQLDAEAQVRFKVKTSPYAARQHENDGDSCGAIVADELVQRCMGQSLAKAETRPVGALALREQQLAQLQQHLSANDATLQQFEARHTRITNGKLTLTQARIAVEKENHYDKTGNTEILIDAANTQDKRTFKSLYDRNNKLVGTVIEKVTVDDPNKTASLTERPEQTIDLTTRIVRDGKGLEVASRDEQGRWTFKIYDSENRLLYTITPGKTVIKTERNSFGEIEREIHFANRLELDTRAYLDTGIPRDVIENGECLKQSAADRVTRYQYNQQSKVVLKEQGPVFYYVPKADGTADFGLGMVQTCYDYNTFGEVIKTAQLINLTTHEWAEERQWRNRAGTVAAECDAIGRVKRYTHNSFDEMEKREELANRLSTLPVDSMTLAELAASLAALRSANDSTYRFCYDANGQKIIETRIGFVLQAVQLDEHNKPGLINLPAQDLTTHHEYNAVGQEIATTYEDGSQVLCYFNECGAKIAETGVARQSWDEAGNPITLIPLTSYGVNSFGQPITTTRYKQGTAKADILQVPTPIAPDAEDQTEARLYDVRGLMQALQDAEGHVKSFTYTQTRKPAREYYPLTNWEQQSPTNYTLKTHMDEKHFSYDANDNAEQLLLVRDGNVVDITQTLHNSFDEPIAEGPGDGTWPLRREFDSTGKIWRHNANSGSYTIQLRDGRGLETLSCQSAKKELDQVEYAKLAEILSWNIDNLEHLVNVRDGVGRASIQFQPTFIDDRGLEVRPVKKFEYDSWDNCITETDELGNTTTTTFNHKNQKLSCLQPAIQVVDEQGKTHTVQPFTRWGYNAAGFQIGKTDANDHSEVDVLNAAGQSLMHILGDGTCESKQQWDALGRVTLRWDDRNKPWRYQYNHNDEIRVQTFPSGKKRTYTYTETNIRNSEMNPAGETYRYNIDVRENIETSFQPMGQATSFLHDRNKQLLEQNNPDGSKLTWQRNYFGIAKSHTDLGGALIQYTYDKKWQLRRQTSQRGQRGSSFKVEKVIKKMPLYMKGEDRDIYIGEHNIPQYIPTCVPMPDQALEFDYRAGLVSEERDIVYGRTTRKLYDVRRRVTDMETVIPHELISRRVRTDYDALDNEVMTVDGNFTEYTSYDAVGNRRFTKGIISGKEYLCECDYDAANRIKITNIQANLFYSGKREYAYVGNTWNYELIYDHDGQVYCKYRYEYDEDGMLNRVKLNDKPWSEYAYDLAGRLQHATEFALSNQVHMDYNANSWLITQHQTSDKGEQTVTYKNFTALGLPQAQTVQYHMPEIDMTDELQLTYIGFDDWHLVKNAGTRTNPYGQSPQNAALMYYDTSGAVAGMATKYTDDYYFARARLVDYINGPEGKNLSKRIIHTVPNASGWISTCVTINSQYFYSANGRVLAQYQPWMDLDLDNIMGLYLTLPNRDPNCFIAYPEPGLSNDIINLNMFVMRRESSRIRYVEVDEVVSKIPFPFSDSFTIFTGSIWSSLFPTIKNTSLGKTTGTTIYQVAIGDTFPVIAQRKCGDSRYAAKIADANGYNVSETPEPGRTLIIPAIMPRFNGAKSAIPYERFMSVMMESLYPALETPQPPKPDDGFLGIVIGAIVGFAIGAILPELLPTLIPALSGTGLTVTIIRTAAAALANAATQGVLIGLHFQHKFSFESVAMSGIAAGLNARFITSKLAEATLAEKLVTYGQVEVMRQLTAMASGLNSRFDMGELMANMFSQAVDAHLHLTDARQVDQNIARGIIDMGIQGLAYREEPDIRLMAAQALGTTVGANIGVPIAIGLANENLRRTQQAAQGQSHHPHSRDNQQPMQQAKPAKRSSTLFDKEQVKASASDEPLSSKPKAEKDPVSQVTTRAKRWQRESSLTSRWDAFSRYLARELAYEVAVGAGLIDYGYETAKSAVGFALHSPFSDVMQSAHELWDAGKAIINGQGRRYFAGVNERLQTTVHGLEQSAVGFYHDLTSDDVLRRGFAEGRLLGAGLSLFAGGLRGVTSGTEAITKLAGDKLIGREISKSIDGIGPIEVELANNKYISQGYFAPYDTNFRPRNVVLANDKIFVRVHGEDNQISKWMMRASEIDGLTPLQIKEKFALEFMPKYMSEVNVSASTKVRVSVAGPQPQWNAAGGGVQYELLQRIPESSFQHPIPIYQMPFEPNYFSEQYSNWSYLMVRR